MLFGAILPFLALALYLDNPGPIFYRQKRASLLRARSGNGRCSFAEFWMLKLRSMRVNAEALTGAVLAEENDPRVTRVGRFLRKTRLDELPQLWNVLIGEMSLVGPRPERPELLENLTLAIPFFEERMRDCKPGITGLAQISLSYSGAAPSGSPLAFLRRTRLDELPQLWNVLRGDMSLIGPRPERPELLQNLSLAIPFFEERMRDCKPGISGLAQISLSYSGQAPDGSAVAALAGTLTNPYGFEAARGALADDMRTKLLFDLAYVAALGRFSTFIATELSIIWLTPAVMLRGLGR